MRCKIALTTHACHFLIRELNFAVLRWRQHTNQTEALRSASFPANPHDFPSGIGRVYGQHVSGAVNTESETWP